MSFVRGLEAASMALATGDFTAAGELRSAGQSGDGRGDSERELVAALVRLGTREQESGSFGEAEQVFRRALEIGERSLGPDDFDLVPALTGLAASRRGLGAAGDAERLMTRALALSETRLGGEHPDHALLLSDLSRLHVNPAREFAKPLLAPLVELKRSNGADREGEQRLDPPARNPAYMDVLLRIQDELENDPRNDREELLEPSVAVAANGAFTRWRRVLLLGGLAAVALPFALGTVWSRQPRMDAASVGELSFVDVPQVVVMPVVQAARVAGDPLPGSPESAIRPKAAAQRPRTASRSRGVRSSSAAPEIDAPDGLVLRVPQPVALRLDSAIRAFAGTARTEHVSESLAVQFKSLADSAVKPRALDAPAQRARLIGAIPTPRYPAEQLAGRRTMVEVRVRFDVDIAGQPVMSTFSVLGSPDTLLATAVREVIPGLRFEPARTPWPSFSPTVDRVELSFRFSPRVR